MPNKNLLQVNQTVFKISDEELIKSYLATQHSIYFNQLYAKYSVKIYGKCLLMLKDKSAAQDATQDIFIKVFSKLSQFKEKSKFSTWVYSITYNYCVDFLRKQRKGENIVTSDIEQIYDLPEDNVLLEKKVEMMMDVLENISSSDKTVLLMKYKKAMPIKEIANVLNKSESAIKMKLKRAKSRAKKVYTEKFIPFSMASDFTY